MLSPYQITLLLVLPILLSYIYSTYISPNPQYSIIIDAGSTGSRLFIYTSSPFSRIGSAKISPGLNAFTFTRDESNDYTKKNKYKTPQQQYVKLFNKIQSIVPASRRSMTPVKILATAGMRLISNEQSEEIYESLREGLGSPFPYPILNISTLSGREEGYYSLLSSNYLLGIIDEDMRRIGGEGMVGSLDMGGSSTQITFDPEGAEEIREEGLFIHSYLGFGGDTLREKVWDKIVSSNSDSNPCAFVGWSVTWGGRTLTGTGSSEKCRSLILSVLDPVSAHSTSSKINIDGIEHPKIRGKFLAMSLYFFASDCLRSMSKGGERFVQNWPNPSPNDMREAVKDFCGRNWEELEPVRGTAHKWTRFDGFPHRCLETVYIHTLLRDGYGFDGDGRDVEFVLEIGGEEVEWTMGMALESRVKSMK
ncbi:hypothetical protein TrVE_jg1861 [Triparma verrucosa]|uniref:Apyrase n=1 Tax=Triparma verrucosa TaxID=1606542 RepID=A0A9W7CBZ7_9STRA|nr:hypothetical protein TrVE_jg1861 [Triparma verrucosa]